MPPRARFLLLGDSHAGPIGRAARAAGIPFQGGPLGAGREFNAGFFDLVDGEPVFRKAEAERLYRGFLAELGAPGLAGLAAPPGGVPLVCTFGFSAHFFATRENWRIYRDRDGAFPPGFLASRLFDDIVCAMARDALAFYRHARGLGLRVLAALPPQRVPALSDREVFMAAQEVMLRQLRAMGVEVVDLRAEVSGDDGLQRPEFSEPDDPIHGNLAFGQLILADLLARGL
ncbi:hypothetical protein H9L41_14375 [Chitinimonas koreensis]|nr:hypothetical protein H9L41_14375 [Chitinimonas koreensis]